MTKFIALMAAYLLLAGCGDDGNRMTRADVQATRDAQYDLLSSADASVAASVPTITTQPAEVATMTPTPQPAPATATSRPQVHSVFVTPVEAVEFKAGESATK